MLYVKELLSDATESVLFDIANELGIDHSFQTSRGIQLRQSKFWVPGYFRLFISHLSPFKGTAAQLQTALLDFGITAFVAHKDIEPTKEWQDEILILSLTLPSNAFRYHFARLVPASRVLQKIHQRRLPWTGL